MMQRNIAKRHPFPCFYLHIFFNLLEGSVFTDETRPVFCVVGHLRVFF